MMAERGSPCSPATLCKEGGLVVRIMRDADGEGGDERAGGGSSERAGGGRGG